MTNDNPFADSPLGAAPASLSDRETQRIVRRIAAEADAGRSGYTTGMLIIATLSCAAILGVCGTTLQDLLTDDDFRQSEFYTIIIGLACGIPLGVVVALFVSLKIQTVFLGGMMGGLLGAITTPAVWTSERSPTPALVTAALVGPLLIVGVSFLFAHFSRRTGPHDPLAKRPKSPWDGPPDDAKQD